MSCSNRTSYLPTSLMLLSPRVLSEESTKIAASGGPDATQIMNLFLSLVLIIALIFVCAWLFRRASAIGSISNKQLKVLGGVSLGAKEKAVLIKAGDKQILVGVAPGSVNAIHVFEEPIFEEDNKSTTGSEFARQLANISKGRKE